MTQGWNQTLSVITIAVSLALLLERSTNASPLININNTNKQWSVNSSSTNNNTSIGQATTVFWVSHPTFPNETSIVSGWQFYSTSQIVVSTSTSSGASTTLVNPSFWNTSSLSFIIPSDLPLAVYSCYILDTDSKDTSNTFYINKPELWWVQGDQGSWSSNGGWLRVFGKSMYFDQTGYIKEYHETYKKIRRKFGNDKELNNNDFFSSLSLDDIIELQSLTLRLKQLNELIHDDAVTKPPKLRLTSVNKINKVVYLTGETINCTIWQGYFNIPSDIDLDEYTIEYSNGLNNYTVYTKLSMFVDQHNYGISSFKIDSSFTFPNKVFNISDYVQSTNDIIYSQKNGQIGYHWDIPLSRAINAAISNGGGTIYIPRGQYYFAKSIQVPNNTLLKGESKDLTILYFRERATSNKQPICYNDKDIDSSVSIKYPRYICGNYTTDDNNQVRWGLKDFTFYISSYHNTVIEVHNRTNYFIMDNVRSRVNGFYYQTSNGVHQYNIFNGSRTYRWANYSIWSGLGELILVHGSNWQITNCDLMTDNIAINSFQWDINIRRHSAKWGYVANNNLNNGASGGCHPMDAWQQVIVEYNICEGNSLLSGMCYVLHCHFFVTVITYFTVCSSNLFWQSGFLCGLRCVVLLFFVGVVPCWHAANHVSVVEFLFFSDKRRLLPCSNTPKLKLQNLGQKWQNLKNCAILNTNDVLRRKYIF